MLLYPLEYLKGNNTSVVRFHEERIWQWTTKQREGEVSYHLPSQSILLDELLISPREPVDCGVKKGVVWPRKQTIHVGVEVFGS